MKKFLLTILCAAMLLTSIGCIACAQETDATQEKSVKIFCIGNSLLIHGPSQGIGWNGNWGMAASCEENDYYHVMQKMFKEEFPEYKTEWSRVGAAGFERGITSSLDQDYTSLLNSVVGGIKNFKPDIVTVQIGDNTPADAITEASFAYALAELVEYCRTVNPDVKVILSKPFYAGAGIKATGAQKAAEQTGVPCVDLAEFNVNEYKAIGQFEHAGVAGHPNDKGMEKVAEAFYSVIRQYILISEGKLDDSVLVNGSAEQAATVKLSEIDGVYYASVKECAKLSGALAYNDSIYNKALCVCKAAKCSYIVDDCPYALINGEIVTLEAKTIKDGDDILVPISVLTSIFDCEVSVIKDLNSVNIKF